MADLQEIVDDLEAEIRRPISVEDRRWRLLAHSAQPDEADAVRRSSILTRETSPDVVAWLDGLGLQRARDLVDVPRNDELGMTRRGVPADPPRRRAARVPVGDRRRPPADRAASAPGCRAAGRRWRRTSGRATARPTSACRRTPSSSPRCSPATPSAATELAATLRWPRDGALRRRGLRRGRGRRGELRRSRAAYDVAVPRSRWPADHPRPRPGAAKGSAERKERRRVVALYASRGRRRRARQAEIAALCARAQPALGPVAAYDELGSWALIAELWTRAEHPEPPPQITALAAHRRGDQLIEALEGLLEHGGDVAEAAKRLNMHRATLYRRLERIEEITGLDLERGDDRLLAHLGLRLLRLNATTVAPAPR